MNKYYGHIIMAMTALMAAACSHDSGLEPEGGGDVPVVETQTPIAFSANQGEEQAVTRAGTPLSDVVTTFKVWGYKNMTYSADIYDGDDSKLQNVFPGYSVDWTRNSAATTTTNSDGWEYIIPEKPEQTIKYWDWSATAYRFFATTDWGGERPADPADYEANKVYGANGTYGPSGAYKSYEMTMAVDVTSRRAIEAMPYFSQLWFSTGNPEAYPTREFGKPVQLEFMKPYTKVRFMYTYAHDSEGVLIEDQCFKPTADYEAVTPTGIARKGTFTVNYPLTGTATKEWYTIERATGEGSGALEAMFEDYNPANPSKEYIDAIGGWYSVFPNTSQGSYTLAVTINRSEKTCVVPAEYMRWLPGYSYTYVFKINEQGGVEIDQVLAAYTDWTDMEGKQEVYNW